MSDKVVRKYSRPYGDCRADKRIYLGGSWPWQPGAECEIPEVTTGPYYIEVAANKPGTYYMWVVTSLSSRELLDTWEVADLETSDIHDVTSVFALSAITALPGVSRTIIFSKAILTTYTSERDQAWEVQNDFVGSYSTSTLYSMPPDPEFPNGFDGSGYFDAITINDYTASSGTIEIADYFGGS